MLTPSEIETILTLAGDECSEAQAKSIYEIVKIIEEDNGEPYPTGNDAVTPLQELLRTLTDF